MSKRPALRGSDAAPLLHWLLVLSGLALFTWLRPDDPDKIVPLWISTVLATALGQIFARLRLRLWLVIFLVFNGMWVLPLTMVHVLSQMSNPWPAVEIFLLAFGPGALCAYLSMSERGGLLAFWFPAALWMLSILDGAEDAALSGPLSWVLLTALAALFVAFLGLQETRRIAVWQAHAMVRLAEPAPTVILRRQPLRLAAQLAWIAMLAAATLGLTAWIAPSLWQKDELPGDQAAAAGSPQGAGASGSAAPCCTPQSFDDAPKSRVREYFSLLRPHGDKALVVPTECVACSDGVPIEVPQTAGTGLATAGAVQGGGGAPDAAAAPLAPSATPTDPFAPVTPTPLVPVAPKPVVAPKPIVAKPHPRPPIVAAVRPSALGGPAWPTHGPMILVVPGEPASGIDPIAWLLTLALSASIVQLSSRPLRRLLALRHLSRPFWPETVDQRVSNLWQLMLVGLRDAGFHAGPGEQPQALARRIDLEGMQTCATVLERARHGVRVDAADLTEMERAAASVYQSARARAGLPARVAASMRWPLI
ncbi:MAG: hypothetical protein ABI193_09715 [Minicystis sp.]